MSWDLRKLNGRVIEMFGTQQDFAHAIGISEHTISKKLNGKSHWTQPEISRACEILAINEKDIPTYFFCPASLEN